MPLSNYSGNVLIVHISQLHCLSKPKVKKSKSKVAKPIFKMKLQEEAVTRFFSDIKQFIFLPVITESHTSLLSDRDTKNNIADITYLWYLIHHLWNGLGPEIPASSQTQTFQLGAQWIVATPLGQPSRFIINKLRL